LIAQTTHDTLNSKITLSQCINYALANQSLIKQSMLDEEITKRDIRIALSGWYPQLEFDANMQHYLQIPIAYYPNVLNPSSPIPYPTTANNTSAGIFSANQTLYNTRLFYAARTAKEIRLQASQTPKTQRSTLMLMLPKLFSMSY